jgi:hypothetical protein
MAPIRRVVRPECHHEDVDHLLFIDPMAKNTTAVNASEIENE